jgi:serine/threonine protein phosphatase PrpC
VKLADGLGLHVAASMVKGRRRSQQDSYFAYGRGGYSLLAVCDGVGGRRGGDVASTFARFAFQAYSQNSNASLFSTISELASYVVQNQERVDRIFEGCPTFSDPAFLGKFLVKAYSARSLKWLCDEVIHPFLKEIAPKCCSTMAAVEFSLMGTVPSVSEYWQGDSIVLSGRGEDYEYSHIDSPAFQGNLDDYLDHPLSNRIWSCLGSVGPVRDRFERVNWDLREGDVYLLCSDGVNSVEPHSFVDVYKIVREALDHGQSLGVALNCAMDSALINAARDNTTIVVGHLFSL